MSTSKHLIFAFVGASGSGKSTLMIELLDFFPHLSIIKSTSTRPRRDESDDLFYKFVDDEYMESEAKENFLSHELFAGNQYVYEKELFDQILATYCGMFAILEHTVPKIRAHGYQMVLINLIPDRDWMLPRAAHREKADHERAQNNRLEFDLVIQNSFKPGGLENSVRQVSEFITQKISSHTSHTPPL
jgi:guanylate kinase